MRRSERRRRLKRAKRPQAPLLAMVRLLWCPLQTVPQRRPRFSHQSHRYPTPCHRHSHLPIARNRHQRLGSTFPPALLHPTHRSPHRHHRPYIPHSNLPTNNRRRDQSLIQTRSPTQRNPYASRCHRYHHQLTQLHPLAAHPQVTLWTQAAVRLCIHRSTGRR